MNSKLFYLCIIVVVFLIQNGLSQGYYNIPNVKVISTDSNDIERKLNDVIGTLADAFLTELEKVNNNSNTYNNKNTNNYSNKNGNNNIKINNTLDNSKNNNNEIENLEEENINEKEDDDNETITNNLIDTPQEEQPKPQPSVVAAPTTTIPPQPSSVDPKPTVIAKPTQPAPPPPPPPAVEAEEEDEEDMEANEDETIDSQENQSKQNPNTSPPSNGKGNNNNNNNNSSSSSPSTSGSNSNNNSNSNSSNVSSGQSNSSSNSNSSSQVSNNNEIIPSTNTNTDNASVDSYNNIEIEQTNTADQAVDNSIANQNQNVVPEISNNDNNKNNSISPPLLTSTVDGSNSEEGKKKGSFFSVAVKVVIGLAVGGICIAGLIVGKKKFGGKDDDEYSSIFTNEHIAPTISANNDYGNSNYEGVESTAKISYQPIDNYSQKLQPSTYLNPSVPSPVPPPNTDFIDTNSIEPLPNLVNKVDVELPIYNIKEENYNTVGRPMDEMDAAASWNHRDNNNNNNIKEGYNNIVPEMGHMIIEHTNCPSFTSSMLEEMSGLKDKNNIIDDKNDNNDNNMKQIIPDIQYATVEVNNEFDSIEIEDEDSNDNDKNMKQIIPDIQYATVEINSEFNSIDFDDDDDFRSTRTNPRVVLDIDARHSVMTSSDSDVKELRSSYDFLAMRDSSTDYNEISKTYQKALRDSVSEDSRDSLSSAESILHKLR